MAKPIIGISGGCQTINDTYRVQAAGERNIEAVALASGGLPLVIWGCLRSSPSMRFWKR